MSYTLIIAEKPDAARRIAESLADEKPKVLEKNNVKYYEFTVNNKKHICVPAVGHLFVLDVKKNGRGWTYPVFDYEWIPTYKRKGTEWTEKYLKTIEYLSKNASDFINAADVDNEGEVILFNILRFLCNRNDAKRMKFSTLTKDELIKAYENMDNHLIFPMIEAGLTRHYLDAMWGFNLTRALTLSLKASGQKGFSILSTGRVQGPTLKILLERENEIRNFKPKPFWEIELHLKLNGQNAIAVYEKGKIWNEEEAKKIFHECKGKDAIVKKVEKRRYKQNPPAPFNTTDLQSEAYTQFKFSPAQTLNIAESLYQAGHISYPRSSSQKLPPAVNYEKIIRALGKLLPYQKFAEDLLKRELKPMEGKRDDPAHPSVFATHETPDLKKLNVYQKKIYDLIARRTLAAFGKPSIREVNTVTLDVNGHKFILTGKRTIEPGWIEIYSPYISREETILPELKSDDVLKVVKIELLSKETQPPGRYSQGSIIKEMEKRNLGTRATRAEILQTLYDRGYIVNKSIEVTKLGEAVVETLKKYCPKIISEELTRHFEKEMEQVYNGKREREKVILEAKRVLEKILEEFKKNEKEIGIQLSKALAEARKKANELGICPKCKNELKIMKAKTGSYFVGCSGYPTCENTYPLPKMAKIKSTGKTCDKCRTPIIQVIRKGRRPFRMCLDTNCPTKAEWK